MPRTQSRRVDLLFRTADDSLAHIELQSTNDPSMPFRMAEYALAILRKYGAYPVQLVLYVGTAKLRMTPGFETGGMVCGYRQVDIRSLDAEALLASANIADNLLAVLAGITDTAGGIRTVLRRIVKMKRPRRAAAIYQLLLTCGLRGLENVFAEEIHDMPIIYDFDLAEKYPFIGELVEKGRQEGRQEGRADGLRDVLQLLLAKRFGRLPESVTKRVAALSDAQAKETALAIFDAKSLDDIFAGVGRERRSER